MAGAIGRRPAAAAVTALRAQSRSSSYRIERPFFTARPPGGDSDTVAQLSTIIGQANIQCHRHVGDQADSDLLVEVDLCLAEGYPSPTRGIP